MPPLLNESGGAALKKSSSGGGSWVVVPVDDMFSDGDEKTWPADPTYESEDPSKYLEKLAKMWMQQTGEYKKGNNYILSQLPKGYKLVAKQRSQSSTRDKFLAGHPSGVLFNSIPKFFDHFQFLMSGGTSQCNCDLCTGVGGKRLGAPDGMTWRNKGKQPARNDRSVRRGKRYIAEDDEGNRDVFKESIYRLKIKKRMDVLVTENDSMDWRAEREQLSEHLHRIGMQHSFIPRVGELVLWCPDLRGEVKFEPKSKTFQMYNTETRRFLGAPKWRAGAVAQVPEEQVLLGDVFYSSKKSMAVNLSGFRIETLPDPLSANKAYSSQYKYVPLSQIRPFNLWDIYLQNISSIEFHLSISYALTVMSSFSLLEKYRFQGDWPDAKIYAKGIYLGAELLVEGDAIRLIPDEPVSTTSYEAVTDVLVIKNICLRLYNCDINVDSPLLSEKLAPLIMGKGFTRSRERAYREPSALHERPKPLTDDEVFEAFQVVSMRQYGPWYRLHAPEDSMEVSLNQILGRCFEWDYLDQTLGCDYLGLDLEGVVSGREYSRETDNRIPKHREWFAGDYRLETLGVETFNGIEVGKYDEARDLRMWQANLQIIDGKATAEDLWDAKLPHDGGRQRASDDDIIGGREDSSQFKSMGRTSSMVSTALALVESSTNVTSARGSPPHEEAHHTENGVREKFAESEVEEVEGGPSVAYRAKSPSQSEQSDDSISALLRLPTVIRGSSEETEEKGYASMSPEPSSKRRRQ